MGHRLANVIKKLNPLLRECSFLQHCQFSTHVLGVILDLAFDDKRSEPASWALSSYSNHVIVLFSL